VPWLEKMAAQEKSKLKQQPGNTKQLNIHQWLTARIQDSLLLDTQLLILTFIIGMQDVATFLDYSCFASNQTGNSVLLAAGVFGFGNNLINLSSIGISLASFVSGGFVAGQIGNLAGPRRRWWLLLSNLLQTIMVFAASALQFVFPIRTEDAVSRVVIALLAFSSGGQVAMTRGLKITEITTAMATAAWVDLFVDERFWRWENRSRNRRVGFLVLLVAGSFVGAWAYRRIGSAFVLLVNALGKAVVLGLLIFNGGIDELKTEEGDDRTSAMV
jgi:uncharacterized membrane protein YoaK (UPF0700 family)